MPTHLDALETRDATARETALMAALPQHLAQAATRSSAVAEQLAGVDTTTICNRAALATLPVIRKHELLERQKASRAAGHDPFGGFSAIGWSGLQRAQGARRVYQSPGPIYEPEGGAADYWRSARAMAAGRCWAYWRSAQRR